MSLVHSSFSSTLLYGLSSFFSEEKPAKKSKPTKTKILIPGTQEGKIGPTHIQTMNETFEKVHRLAEKGVTFNEDRLVNYLYGGTCTAMVFSFIMDYLKSSELELVERVSNVMKNHVTSCEKFRAQQIAFNTIEQDFTCDSDDFKRAKVQSLANYYDLEFDYASEDMHIDFINQHPEFFEDVIERLPEGIYFLRILRPSCNYKKEVYGHSTLYIKDEQGDYFYDPNYGLTEIAENEVSQFLREHLNTLEIGWRVKNPRFYRIKV